MTTFFMNSVNEPQPMPNRSILPFTTVLQAAKEFSKSADLPPSVTWFEL
jgi:hypothetical protein